MREPCVAASRDAQELAQRKPAPPLGLRTFSPLARATSASSAWNAVIFWVSAASPVAIAAGLDGLAVEVDLVSIQRKVTPQGKIRYRACIKRIAGRSLLGCSTASLMRWHGSRINDGG